jgi:hypothetical protein
VRTEVSSGKKADIHVGQVAVRSSGSFRVGKVNGVTVRFYSVPMSFPISPRRGDSLSFTAPEEVGISQDLS